MDQGSSQPRPRRIIKKSCVRPKLLAKNIATCAKVRALTSSTQESLRLADLRQQADEYQQLKHSIHMGFPAQRSQLPDQCRRYWNVLNQLTVEDGLIVFGCRLLIPSDTQLSPDFTMHTKGQFAQSSVYGILYTGLESIKTLTTSSCNVSNVRRPFHPNHVNQSSLNLGQPAPSRKLLSIFAHTEDNSS